MFKKSLFYAVAALIWFSVFLPIVASFFDEPRLKFLPLAFLITLNLALMRHIKIEVSSVFYVVVLSLFTGLNFLLAERNPLGLQIVILQGILFAGLFQLFSDSYLKKIGTFISGLFAFIILFAFVEWMLILGGYQALLAETLTSNNIKSYKMTNSAAFMNWTWGETSLSGDVIFGANGPTLGSQGLSQLMLMSFFWFLPIQKVERLSLFRISMCCLAVLGVMFCATMTVTLTAALIFFYLLLLDNGSRLNNWVVKAGLLAGVILLGEKFFRIIFVEPKIIGKNI